MNIPKIYLNYINNMIETKPNIEKIIVYWKLRKNTMVSPQRLNNIWEIVKKIKENEIKGDMVECGVWKGGCVALMSYLSEKYNLNKKIWAFDSFEGLPEPTKNDGKKAKNYSEKNNGKLESINKCISEEIDLINIFNKLHLNCKKLKIEKGWFQETLPKAKKKIKSISLLRLDGDWYESTKTCIENLYPLVENGGYIIIDDYFWWPGNKKALDEYSNKYKIKNKMHRIDSNAAYFIKNNVG